MICGVTLMISIILSIFNFGTWIPWFMRNANQTVLELKVILLNFTCRVAVQWGQNICGSEQWWVEGLHTWTKSKHIPLTPHSFGRRNTSTALRNSFYPKLCSALRQKKFMALVVKCFPKEGTDLDQQRFRKVLYKNNTEHLPRNWSIF